MAKALNYIPAVWIGKKLLGGDDHGEKKYNMNQYKKDITAGRFDKVAPQLPQTLMPDSRLKQSRTNSLNAMANNKTGLMI